MYKRQEYSARALIFLQWILILLHYMADMQKKDAESKENLHTEFRVSEAKEAFQAIIKTHLRLFSDTEPVKNRATLTASILFTAEILKYPPNAIIQAQQELLWV